jgi:lipopolysaccharide exporter
MNGSNSSLDQSRQSNSGPGLFQRVVKGGVWVIALRVFTYLLDLVRFLLLANLLGRTKWGLLALALLAVTVLKMFTQTGFNIALIQKRDDTESYLNTVWTVGLVRGVVLCVLLCFFAPYVADFFDSPPTFRLSHIHRPTELVMELRDGTGAVSQCVRSGFSEQTRGLLDAYDGSQVPSKKLLQALAEELNRVVEAESLYGKSLFTEEKISDYARRLIAEAEQTGDFSRLNRRFLQESYPGLIKEAVIDARTLTTVIQVLSLSVLLSAFCNIGTVYFKKELEFHKQFLYQISSKLLGIIVTIVIVLVYRSIWALVWGRLAATISTCAISYLVHPYRPRIHFEPAKAKELWQFGRWILFTSILSFIMTKGDDIFVGKYLGPAMLGLYLLAYKLSQAPATEITLVFSEVTFPAFSKLQDDLDRLRKAYLKVLHFTAFITVPLSGLIFILAPDFIHLFMTAEWYGVIPVMQILAVKGLLHSLRATMGPVWRGIGKPYLNLKLRLGHLAILVILIYPLTARWGIVGTAWAILASAIVMQPFGYYLLMSTIKCRLREVLNAIMPPLVGMLFMVAVIMLVRRSAFSGSTFVSLFALAVIGAGCYLVVSCLFEKLSGYNIRGIIQEQVAVLLGKGSRQNDG